MVVDLLPEIQDTDDGKRRSAQSRGARTASLPGRTRVCERARLVAGALDL
jgi:hypothetical protein